MGLYNYGTETKQQSSERKTPSSPRPKKARQVRSNIKSMVSFFTFQKLCVRSCSTRSDCQWEFFLRGFETTEGKCEAQTAWDLEEMRLVVAPWQYCTHLARCEGIHDKKITWPLFPNLPAHLTWSPYDFYVFPKMKLRLKRRRFLSIEEIQAESQQVLNTLTPADFNECFQKWQNRWYRRIQAQGDGGN